MYIRWRSAAPLTLLLRVSARMAMQSICIGKHVYSRQNYLQAARSSEHSLHMAGRQ